MSTLNDDLSDILATLACHGDYYAAGTSECAIPNLQVDGVGRISLPLLPIQAEQLIAVASRSPFGRGEETLIDTKVRKTWQIPAEQVRITGHAWRATLEAVIARAAAGLGVKEPVTAELYKMLVYDTGSFFVEHRDTEKCIGMFATLVLVLPSECSGGELIVRHKGREVSLALTGAVPTDIAYAAFYADCVHEVRPVTSGNRLALIYNLVRKTGAAPPTLPDDEAQTKHITALLRRWVDTKLSNASDSAEKLVIPLEHAYTPAELAFSALKNADAAAASALISAAAAAEVELHLALLEIEESGSAEHMGYAPRGRGRWHSDEEDDEGLDHAGEFEVIDVIDSSLLLSNWRRPDGADTAIHAMPCLEEELCPLDTFADIEPDEQHFHEATGNEGASFERSYRRAALVLWPKARLLDVLDQAGLEVSLPYLADLALRWKCSGEDHQGVYWRDAHALSALMLARWQASHCYGGPGMANDTSSFLSSLMELDDTDQLEAFLRAAPAMGCYHGAENDALVRAASLLAPDRACDIMEKIIVRNAQMHPAACANLLARLADDARRTTTRAMLHGSARSFVDVLLGARSEMAPAEPWQRPTPICPALIEDLLTALGCLGDATLAERAVAHILANPHSFGIDTILIPAMLNLAARGDARLDFAAERLRRACLTHLQTRIAEPLAPPSDLARACTIACHCKTCAELELFLADAERAQWTCKAAEQQRRHVETMIQRSGCDLDVALSKVGRPYSLVATKNRNSYERRVAQRKHDLAVHARLALAPAS